jgi:hypothetical protein
MMFFLAFELAHAAVEFVDKQLSDVDNAKKKEAALEFARTELMNLQAAGKLGRRNDGSDNIAQIMPLVSEAIDIAVLITHAFKRKKNVAQTDPSKSAVQKVKPSEVPPPANVG